MPPRRAPFGILWALLLAPLSAHPSAAQWPADGLPVCTAVRDQSSIAMVGDVTHGAITAWVDPRSGYNVDIVVQRVSPLGAIAPGWTPQGYFATYYGYAKDRLQSVPDGAGGAYLVWEDIALPVIASGVDIRLQRVTGSGIVAPPWPRNGLPVCTASNDQRTPKLAPDGEGGVYVVWRDQRVGSLIYASRIDADSVVHAGWPADGMRVCLVPSTQFEPATCEDGAGGVYIAWEDQRFGNSDIYIVRLKGDGAPANGWSAGGTMVTNATGDQRRPMLAPDGIGGVMVAWSDYRSGQEDVYAARMTSGGSLAAGWTPNGTLVCGVPTFRRNPTLVADGAGGATVLWEDWRANAWKMYAQRLDSAGTAQWTADGVTVCVAPGEQAESRAVRDDSGGLYVVWQDTRDLLTTGQDVYSQRLLADGSRAWGDGGIARCVAYGSQSALAIVEDGIGGAQFAWRDERSVMTTGTDIYVARIGADGTTPGGATALEAVHHDGQTFLSWATPPGVGWTYRVFASPSPILTSTDLDGAIPIAVLGDSAALDVRLSRLTGTLYGYAVDSGAAGLPPDHGLCVMTTEQDGSRFFAVTAQATGHPENRVLIPGDNTLVLSVDEQVGVVRPVHQREMVVRGIPSHIYTLWTWHHELPGFPSMSNRPGLPFDCAVVRGGDPPEHPIVVRPHARTGNFLQCVESTGQPGEWRLALDDILPNGENTFWYGYHEGTDVTAPLTDAPLTGTVNDYTLQRVLYTIHWALRTFPVDSERVYLQGYSMAGMGGTLLALRHPELFAGQEAIVGKYDFSDLADDNPACAFNPGGLLRSIADRLWGGVATNLTTREGGPVYLRLNGNWMLDQFPQRELPPLVSFIGRNDDIVGWTEKVSFMTAMQAHRQGGCFFWDTRNHIGTSTAYWSPMQVSPYIGRWRRDASFPALTNCSTDNDPGDGGITHGDSVGTINGFVEWDPEILDQVDHWEIGLHLRNLMTRSGPLAAPESLTVDVTPRRLQQLVLLPGILVSWWVSRDVDGAEIQSGQAMCDSLGLVTIEQVRVHRTGVRLHLEALLPLGAAPIHPLRLAFSRLPNPISRSTSFEVSGPASERLDVSVIDLAGRRCQVLHSGALGAAPLRVAWNPGAVAPGVYFLVADSGRERIARRFVVLR